MSDSEAVRLGRHLLYREDGSRRPDEEVLAQCGSLGLRLAKLADALARRQQRPFALNYPPRIFVSYKWGTDAQNRWVGKLAEGIRARGFAVVYDGYRDETEDHDVEDFVSRIADCSVFVAVITNAYAASADGRQATWVYDEVDVALLAQNRGLMQVVTILREEGACSRMRGFPVIDMRDDAKFEECLDQHFHYDGPSLSGADREDVERAFNRSLQQRAEGRAAEAAETLGAVTDRFPFVRDAWLQQMQCEIESREFDRAIEVARRGAECVLPFDDPYQLVSMEAMLLADLKRNREAMRAGLRILMDRSTHRHDGYGHHVVGNILDDEGDSLGGRNHLIRADRMLDSPAVHNALGVVYMHLGCWEKAIAIFEETCAKTPDFVLALSNKADALCLSGDFEACMQTCREILAGNPDGNAAAHATQLEAALRAGRPPAGAGGRPFIEKLREAIPTPWVTCDECDAIYPVDDRIYTICGDCAAVRSPRQPHCKHCGNSGIVPFQLLVPAGAKVNILCPTCRQGALTLSEKVDI